MAPLMSKLCHAPLVAVQVCAAFPIICWKDVDKLEWRHSFIEAKW